MCEWTRKATLLNLVKLCCRGDLMATPSHLALIAALVVNVLVIPTQITVCADIVLEEGYTVTTVFDGNKQHINPHSVLPLSLSSSDLIVLDSVGSAFYTLPFPNSQESVLRKYSGRGEAGFLDGELGSAMFNKPKSFTIDFKGNVYVADQTNHAIRKISKSGVTTIAGGYSQKPGHKDGPAQNASFSDDFELTFIPESCALIISDRGSKLLRQINLKVEDCAKSSQSVLGMPSAWLMALALGFSCLLLGVIAGFYIRPYVVPREGSSRLHYSETWKHFLISLGRRVLILCFDIRSAVVSSTSYVLVRKLIILSLSHVTLMFSFNKVECRKGSSKPVSLLDNDDLGCSAVTKPQIYAEQLKDFVSLDGGLESSHNHIINEVLEEKCETEELDDNLHESLGKIDRMIQSNLIGFVYQTEITSLADQEGRGPSLIKRKCCK